MSKICWLDSGAFSMARESRKHGGKKFYESKVFWNFVDRYGAFVQKWKDSIDYCANVDTSHFPDITYKVQKYLEKNFKIKPLPVLHHGESFDWIRKYIDEGYKYICIGGVAKTKGYSKWRTFQAWGDQAFKIICPKSNDFFPLVKVHGFAITTIPLMRKYPWYTVDSVTWKKMSYYGQILVPPLARDGGWNFNRNPLVIFMDKESKYMTRDGDDGKHYRHLPKGGREHVRRWLKFIGTPFGKRGSRGSIIIPGVSNDPHFRCQATIRYFLEFQKSLPKWPWQFQTMNRIGLKEIFCK